MKKEKRSNAYYTRRLIHRFALLVYIWAMVFLCFAAKNVGVAMLCGLMGYLAFHNFRISMREDNDDKPTQN